MSKDDSMIYASGVIDRSSEAVNHPAHYGGKTE